MEWSSYSYNIASHSRYVSVLLSLSLLVFLWLLIEFSLLPFVLVFFCFILKQVFSISFIVMCIAGVSVCFRFIFYFSVLGVHCVPCVQIHSLRQVWKILAVISANIFFALFALLRSQTSQVEYVLQVHWQF